MIISLIGAALFIWMARSSKSGKNWARITGTVLFGLSVLIMVYNFRTVETTVTGILNLLISPIGLAAVTLLWPLAQTRTSTTSSGRSSDRIEVPMNALAQLDKVTKKYDGPRAGGMPAAE